MFFITAWFYVLYEKGNLFMKLKRFIALTNYWKIKFIVENTYKLWYIFAADIRGLVKTVLICMLIVEILKKKKHARRLCLRGLEGLGFRSAQAVFLSFETPQRQTLESSPCCQYHAVCTLQFPLTASHARFCPGKLFLFIATWRISR